MRREVFWRTLSAPVGRVNRARCTIWQEDAMNTAKHEVSRMLDELPDDVSFEDIQYHIYVRQKVARGLQDAQDGRLVSHDEAERRLSKWVHK